MAGRPGGSSPLARGTGSIHGLRELSARFIPACAGNGSSSIAPKSRRAVHPRLRGERMVTRTQKAPGTGSSPLARGTAVQPEPTNDDLRFIPACAGNGPRAPHGRCPRAVHPRLRGERDVEYTLNPEENGSSPLARGTAAPGRRQPTRARFIPACAGNGPPTWIPSTPTRGSSPLARGTGLYPGT